MKFRKPPVIEVWISLDFEPNEKKQHFDPELVKQYLKPFREELPRGEVRREREFTMQTNSPNELPETVQVTDRIQHFRQWDEARSQMLQVGDDQLSFHVLKSANETPGYGKVRQAAQPKLEAYVDVFRPSAIRHATLHYLDIIDIPVPPSGKIDLQDFFPYASDLPESPFGAIAAFVQQFQIACPVDDGPLFMRLQTLPAPQELSVLRFRLEWHKQSSDVNTLDLEQVWKRMDIAHDYMWNCFTTALSKATLHLFEPIPEEENS